ncbi:glycine cleavage system aminomethyltransferase GcvT [Blattabacterium sp. (Blaberus giganteus)]|uniref:glycine cleavage system aminomethyltransferase GcvT n=1 Tax=Blattabacterium sp. (Blaberus giganteus) TaxID=1186051 RepID=UPI00025F6FC0|nr:glycine cleavage system aminomethyltransferase GcvT [Blattabacterium sp. (Blaberus giganteus)]AFJ90876.1 glycine cleavage system aminomethyltransferase T [Blattabacterium sp. (Blaberus giganteus)]
MRESHNLKKTILYDNHICLGAKMVNYSGFYIPLQYTSSLTEHMSVRNSAGVFDVSHMGKFILKGKHSVDLIQYITTNDLSKIKIGQAQYNCFINKKGGIIDDLVIYKISEEKFLLIVNAANIEKNRKWIKNHIVKYKYYDVELIDHTLKYSILAIQGPMSLFYTQKLTNISLNKISFYHFEVGEFSGIKNVLISRTGYTGSKGIEIYVSNKNAEKIWNDILEIDKIIPCGIASRNSLRLEMGYRLYGQDISEKITPVEANLSWIIKFEKEFIAKEILQKQKKEGKYKKFISFLVEEKNKIPRQGHLLIDENNISIGYVTSGVYSPVLKKGIGLGYLTSQKKTNSIFIFIRNQKILIKMVKLPFIKVQN